MKNNFLRNLMVLFVLSVLASCGGSTSTVSDAVPTSTSTVIGHFGFDFSANTSDATVAGFLDDGWSNNWGCGDAPTTTGVFWCPSNANTTMKFKNMGAVSLATVTALPTAWDSPIEAVVVGNVYVAETADGYVVFSITAIDAATWDITVEFLFSSTGSFL